MPFEELLLFLRRRPFEPFRIIVLDGQTYDIRHPDLVLATTGAIYVGTPHPDHPGLAYRMDVVAMRHVSRLEPLGQPAE